MEPQTILEHVEEAMSPRRVFGDPVTLDGLTVLPVATVSGGGGGGQRGESGHDRGVGFGLGAKPAGVFVVRDNDVAWRPALNLNRIALGAEVLAFAGILTVGSIARCWLTRKA